MNDITLKLGLTKDVKQLHYNLYRDQDGQKVCVKNIINEYVHETYKLATCTKSLRNKVDYFVFVHGNTIYSTKDKPEVTERFFNQSNHTIFNKSLRFENSGTIKDANTKALQSCEIWSVDV